MVAQKKISSFDIFDTCLVRRCGTPANMLDVLSLRVFNRPVEGWERQEFVVARKKAEDDQWRDNAFAHLEDIYRVLTFAHPALKSKLDLVEIEERLEDELLVPVVKMRDKIDELRKGGNHIVFLSDMYLSGSFIRKKMIETGFLKDGDSLYVSCETGCKKQDGSLFRYVAQKEGLQYRLWKHTGDDRNNDYLVPRQMGISSELVRWCYNPFPAGWISSDYSLGFKYPSVLAGLSRAMNLSNEESSHRNFVIDIIAPFYCSWIFQVLRDASSHGIQRLYFCARDGYQIYQIALRMQKCFPELGLRYIYMSREALYREENDAAKSSYFEKAGLATKSDKVAIVDTTTSGHTIAYLNDYLESRGSCRVSGYYYLLWNQVDELDRKEIDVKVFDDYIKFNPLAGYLLSNVFVFENFFALNSEKKTIDYSILNGISVPVFKDSHSFEDCWMADGEEWTLVHRELLCEFADAYVELGLGSYSDEIFNQYAMPGLFRFFSFPEKFYVRALEGFLCQTNDDGESLPIVRHLNLRQLLDKRSRNYKWRRGSVAHTLPSWLLSLIYRYEKRFRYAQI